MNRTKKYQYLYLLNKIHTRCENHSWYLDVIGSHNKKEENRINFYYDWLSSINAKYNLCKGGVSMKKDNRPYAEIVDEGIKKQNEEFKNALKKAGWTNDKVKDFMKDEDINWNYDSPEWNKKEREDT